MATKKYRFAGGGKMEDVSPEDIAEMRAMERAGKAFDQTMPEADTTFGALKRAASLASSPDAMRTALMSKPETATLVEGYRLGKAGLKKLMEEGKNRKINKGETTNPMGDAYKKGGKVSSASKRADGIAQRGKTRGTMVACGGGYMKGGK